MDSSLDKSVITQKIKEVQDEYYGEVGKNTIFKKKQKLDCAEKVTQHIELDELLHYSMYIIPNTNRIFVDYTVLKTYLCPDVYGSFIIKFMDLIDVCVSRYGSYEFYFNLDGLTVSAFERYQDIFPLFYDLSEKKGKCFSDNMDKCVMINSPSVTDILMKLFKPFMDIKVKNTICHYNKKETPDKLAEIFS
jgi:hypothetical protein